MTRVLLPERWANATHLAPESLIDMARVALALAAEGAQLVVVDPGCALAGSSADASVAEASRRSSSTRGRWLHRVDSVRRARSAHARANGSMRSSMTASGGGSESRCGRRA
jgi:hypothetical protein